MKAINTTSSTIASVALLIIAITFTSNSIIEQAASSARSSAVKSCSGEITPYDRSDSQYQDYHKCMAEKGYDALSK